MDCMVFNALNNYNEWKNKINMDKSENNKKARNAFITDLFYFGKYEKKKKEITRRGYLEIP